MADGISVWIPVITALAGIGGALGSQYISHRFTLNREKKASEDKMLRERYFIATRLVFILERFAQRCVHSANESGEYDQDGRIEIEYSLPEINFESITGDWRSLPPGLMYRLAELPVICREAASSISAAFNEDTPYDGSYGIFELNRQSARLGLKAIRLSRWLRQLCDMPGDRLSDDRWSAWSVLYRKRWEHLRKSNNDHRRYKRLPVVTE